MVTATVTAAAVAVTAPRTVASDDVGISLNVTNGIEETGCANMRQRNKAVYKFEAFRCFLWDKDGGRGAVKREVMCGLLIPYLPCIYQGL